MLRLLTRPRWMVGHVVALVAIVAFASLSLWQLRRLDDRLAYNAQVAGGLAAAPVPLHALDGVRPDALAYRRVVLTGTYDAAAEVFLSTRSSDGRPGHHVLTPLRTADGRIVVVDRGWVPLDRVPPAVDAAPPEGEVTVEGVLFPSVPARRSGAFDGGPGALQFVSDVDLSVLARVTRAVPYPLWVLADTQVPPQPGELPVPGELPPLTEGSHRSYAIQWFLFTGVVLVGYPVLLWRTHRVDGAAEPTTPKDSALVGS
jgi:cytochrome oxidase assembly protein ShyY1